MDTTLKVEEVKVFIVSPGEELLRALEVETPRSGAFTFVNVHGEDTRLASAKVEFWDELLDAIDRCLHDDALLLHYAPGMDTSIADEIKRRAKRIKDLIPVALAAGKFNELEGVYTEEVIEEVTRLRKDTDNPYEPNQNVRIDGRWR